MKPSIPKGTRDFGPKEVRKRQYIMSVLKAAFEKYGYQPIETPSFENLNTLMGKYGEEGDRLIFKILRSGDFFSKIGDEPVERDNARGLGAKITDKALRYDLTVPFARYVVQHQNELEFPFKRFQMQPVWRADRPQKGRFREFYQCDADVVGSDSLLQEIELVQLYDEAFSKLGLKVTIRMNNRKILAGIAEVAGIADKLIDFTVALDKLDKIGEDGVLKEMTEKGISEEQQEKIKPIINATGSSKERLQFLKKYLKDSEIGTKGVEEARFVFENIENLGLLKSECELDLTLARGLNYYTGAIFEVEAKDVQIGSIGGGGRYDDLTGIFGMKNLSGVGISFGLDRIYLCLDELNLFPNAEFHSTKVLFANFGEAEALKSLEALNILRQNGVSAEIYPSKAKMKKQFDYAEKKGIAFLAMVGSEEMERNSVQLKNLETGEQRELTLVEVVAELS
ncbi:MAG: histidine--tRNA ligase [Schleiferiaceae bacterium]|jgi:histidyl-tRNA synthetase|nr:histidine--tRNA ligase [Schleiferiaceae bacterium]